MKLIETLPSVYGDLSQFPSSCKRAAWHTASDLWDQPSFHRHLRGWVRADVALCSHDNKTSRTDRVLPIPLPLSPLPSPFPIGKIGLIP